ncbi:MAG: Uncharacterized protein G01um101472_162 [Parcubacteria group bacterium Gr01-1014_72]|nr:MAG: Uncharacterized protein G01um101472_162 [Parcubacteria group bacterium Gr01-1014_72]
MLPLPRAPHPRTVRTPFSHFDWLLFFSVMPLVAAGLATMNSFTGGEEVFFERQLVALSLSVGVFLLAGLTDWRFIRRTGVLISIFFAVVLLLGTLLVTGTVVKGVQSWYSLYFFNFQPAELAKLVLILILAKYFSRRHIEIAHIRHILVSGVYTLILFLLVLLQPDFGSAIIIFLIWFGMVLLSGISKKHLLLVLFTGVLSFAFLSTFVFKEYQKERILSFVHPLADVRGAGYNAYQSTIAVGSGGLFGKGLGYGTQSRLKFLPEYQTDFVFAAFAEEWGFLGVLLLLVLFGILITRILVNALHGATNFEILFGLGLAVYFMSHLTIHMGMNVGLLPVTGITLPFVSYGGTHLLIEFLGLGMLMGMRRYRRTAHREEIEQNELHGVLTRSPQ